MQDVENNNLSQKSDESNFNVNDNRKIRENKEININKNKTIGYDKEIHTPFKFEEEIIEVILNRQKKF